MFIVVIVPVSADTSIINTFMSNSHTRISLNIRTYLPLFVVVIIILAEHETETQYLFKGLRPLSALALCSSLLKQLSSEILSVIQRQFKPQTDSLQKHNSFYTLLLRFETCCGPQIDFLSSRLCFRSSFLLNSNSDESMRMKWTQHEFTRIL